MSKLSSRWADMEGPGELDPENKPTQDAEDQPEHKYATGASVGSKAPVAESQTALDARARRVFDTVDRELHRLNGVGWKGLGVAPEIEVEISDTLLLKIKFALSPETADAEP